MLGDNTASLRFRLRNDTAANWTSLNPVLAEGEPGVEIDTHLLKMGDGVTHWVDLAYTGEVGPMGPEGPQGPTGATGPAGPANVLSIGTVTTGAAGSAAGATITGTSPSQVLNLTIPQGVQGVKGDTGNTGATGDPGPANVLSIGTVTTGAPGSAAGATITGTSPSQVLDLTIPRGDTGATGPTGATGRSVDSITRTSGTGAAGTTDTYTITYSDTTTSTFNVYNGADGTGTVNSVNGILPVSGDVTLGAADVGALTQTDGDTRYVQLALAGQTVSGSLVAASGTEYGLTLAPTINQSSTAAYTALGIDVTETATGSGGHRLADFMVGGESRFIVNSAGSIYQQSMPTANTQVFASKLVGDTAYRWYQNADGKLNWGPGTTGAADTFLYRSDVGVLKTDGSFEAVGPRFSLGATYGGSSGIEMGRTDGSVSTPFIDFHSGATATDYDTRIIASGGDGTNGKGSLTIQAGGGVTLTGSLDLPGDQRITLASSGAGVGAPTLTTYSPGTKVVLYNSISASSPGYALGIESSNVWFSSGGGFKFYGNGATNLATLSGTGALTLSSNVVASNGAFSAGVVGQNNNASTDMSVAGLQTRNDNTSGYPSIAFHRSGAWAPQLRAKDATTFQFVSQPGTDLVGLQISDLLVSGNTSAQIQWTDEDNAGAGRNYWWHNNSGTFYLLQDRTGNGSWESTHPLRVTGDGLINVDIGLKVGGSASFKAAIVETVVAIGGTGTQTCDLSQGSYFATTTMTGAITPSFTNVPTGGLVTVQVEYLQGATPYAVNTPTGGYWMGSAPTQVANKRCIVTYQTRNGGTTWFCSAAVQA